MSVLHVIDVKKNIQNILSLNHAELTYILTTESDLPEHIIKSITDSVLEYQYNKNNYLQTNSLPEITLRMMISNPAFVPIVIDKRGPNSIKTRLMSTIKYINSATGTSHYGGPEEVLNIIGLLPTADKFGFKRRYVSLVSNNLENWLRTGTYENKNIPVLLKTVKFFKFHTEPSQWSKIKQPCIIFPVKIDDLLEQYLACLDYLDSFTNIYLTTRWINSKLSSIKPGKRNLQKLPPGDKSMLLYINSAFLDYLQKMIESIEPFNLVTADVFDLTIWYDFFRLKVVLGMQMLVNRLETDYHNFILNKIQQAYEKTINIRVQKASDENNTKIKTYVQIAARKFGITTTNITSMAQLTALFSPEQNKIIEREYIREERAWLEQITNKCPHVALARKLRNSWITDSDKILEELEKYFDEASKKDDWIMCNNCKLPIICPHVSLLITLQKNNVPYDEMRTQLSTFNTKIKSKSAYTYFCKICAEELAEFTTDDVAAGDILGPMGEIDKGFQRLLWGETLKILKSVKFNTPVDTKQFANTAVKICYPLLVVMEKKLFKHARASQNSDLFDPRLHLYAVIYVYAYILNLIRSSLLAQKNIRIGFDGAHDKAKISDYVSIMIKAIKKNYFRLIIKLDNITDEFLINRFREAYKHIITRNGNQIIVENNLMKTFLNEIVAIDPIYHYILTVVQVNGLVKLLPSTSSKDIKQTFEVVMGKSLTSLADKTTSKYSNKKTIFEMQSNVNFDLVHRNANANIYGQSYAGVNINPEKFAYVLNELNLYSSASLRTWYGGGAKMAKSFTIEDMIFNRGFELFMRYSIKLNNDDDWTKYLNDNREFLEYEYAYSQLKILNSQLPHYTFHIDGKPDLRTRQFDDLKSQVNICNIYDEEGLKHKWDIYIYANADSQLELKKSQIRDADLTMSDFIDYRCSVCKVLYSTTHELDEKTTLSALKVTTDFNSFFIYFESRCPEDGLHTFVNDRCSKCSLHFKLIKEYEKNYKGSREYYDKYYQVYVKARTILLSVSDSMKSVQNVDNKKHDEYKEWALAWKYNFNTIMTAAKNMAINHFLLEGIGASENRKYEDIQAGIGIPDPPEIFNDPTIKACDATILSLVSHYNILRNYTKVSQQPDYITNLLKKHAVPAEYWSELPKYFPLGFVEKYFVQREAIRLFTTPMQVHKFIINSIADFINMIYDISGEFPWIEQLAKGFLKYEVDMLIYHEKLLSEPGAFDFMIFGNEVTGLDDITEDNLDNYTGPGTEGEDVLPNDEDETDPFSAEGMDIDTTDNLEG